jgi:hypothetical protein
MQIPDTAEAGIHDFDFLIGKWNIRNHRLKFRFSGCDEWDEFPAELTMHTILGGVGNMDEIRFPTKGYTASTLRLFNRQTKEWSLYWVTDRDGALLPPVTGRFENGRGELYGDDVDGGRPIRVRYIWSKITSCSAQWEQAFSLDQGSTWETNWIMEMTRTGKAAPGDSTSNQECCPVVELRQYAMKSGRRDELIALFDEHFIEGQERYGMKIIGQFRDLNDPDRFVWLRGFTDMEARRRALDGFYNGPIWMEHRMAANDTMLDSSNVLLLEPPRLGSGIRLSETERSSTNSQAGGLIIVTIYYLGSPDRSGFADFFETSVTPALRRAGTSLLGQFVTSAAENTFPRLPVREGEFAFLWLASFPDDRAYAAYRASLESDRFWNDSIVPALNAWISKPAEILKLAPASRSLLRHR